MSKDGFMVEGQAPAPGPVASGFQDEEGAEQITSAPRQRVKLSEIQILIAPNGSLIAPELGLKVVVVEDLAQIGVEVVAADDSVTVLQITSNKVLKAFVENVDLFNTETAVLMHIPTGDYDAYFEQATWQLKKISYDTLVGELAAARESNAAVKKVERLDSFAKGAVDRRPKPGPKKEPGESAFVIAKTGRTDEVTEDDES